MVEKLQLPIIPHPSPYKLQCHNDQECLSVNFQVELPISIGDTYQDKILCDVLPLAASHIILGRPWLFDNRVIHDGYSNSYAFQSNGKHVVLNPMKPEKIRIALKEIHSKPENRTLVMKKMSMGKGVRKRRRLKHMSEINHDENDDILCLFHSPLQVLDLRANLFQARGDDGNQVNQITEPITLKSEEANLIEVPYIYQDFNEFNISVLQQVDQKELGALEHEDRQRPAAWIDGRRRTS